MKLKITWASMLTLLFSVSTLQFSQSALQASQKMTNYGNIAPLDPGTDIFWEYGAESGDWDAWDISQPDSQLSVVTSPARTGTRSIKLYQPSPAKTDYERRVMIQELDTKAEYYASCWVYFPDNMIADGMGGDWTVIGCAGKKWFVKGGVTYGTSIGATMESLHTSGGNHRHLKGGWRRPFDPNVCYPQTYYEIWTLDSSTINTWVHFQFYTKWSNSTDGVVRLWINNILKVEVTNIITDPRGYPQWDGTCYLINDHPDVDWGYFAVYNYQDKTSPESWLFYDDVVLSDTKVPETYSVSH